MSLLRSRGLLPGEKMRTSDWGFMEPIMRTPHMVECSVAKPRATLRPTKGNYEVTENDFLVFLLDYTMPYRIHVGLVRYQETRIPD